FGFLGLGVSGGESGARHGPAMMAGGTEQNYGRVREILEAIAAKYQGEPCVAHVGSGAAGHYVKTVHNGIEYGMMQLIAEAYDLFRRGFDWEHERIGDLFAQWNEGPIGGFLIEITAQILRYREEDGTVLVDLVSDKAKAKGTGKWTSQDALDLGVPVPTIDAAVSARILSAYKSERLAVSADAPLRVDEPSVDEASLAERMEGALHASFLTVYAQGLAQIAAASQEYGFDTDLETVARIWRAGCIVRSRLLEPIREAYAKKPEMSNLLLDPSISATLKDLDASLREVAAAFPAKRIPAPCFSASLAYLDGYRSVRLPANLIQAQRDLFGAHTFERLDREGAFHSEWGL
ncbi:MAG TPA: NADP-dependent phosphogluconate dehydrogenase, partial [Fimbriimonas sp.]